MGKPERDPITGQYTTGHSWNGIRELKTPIPQWWLLIWFACIAFALIYVFLLPSVPLGEQTTAGQTDYTARLDLARTREQAREAQLSYLERIETLSLEEIMANSELQNFAFRGGMATFQVNCIACHGVGGGGQIGQFPSLTDDDWIWGGTLEDIYLTIAHGVRNDDDAARFSLMPIYGDIFTELEIEQSADYVLALNPSAPNHASRASMPGAVLFEENCAACHGMSGEGGPSVGAPRLNDAIWLYGGERDEVIAQIANPKMGMMPAFAPRIRDDNVIKMLTVYVHSLGGGELSEDMLNNQEASMKMKLQE